MSAKRRPLTSAELLAGRGTGKESIHVKTPSRNRKRCGIGGGEGRPLETFRHKSSALPRYFLRATTALWARIENVATKFHNEQESV